MAKVKVGIVGTGLMGRRHAREYHAIRNADLSACYDVNTKRARTFAKQHQIPKVASSLDDLIDVSDAISVVTPDATHAKLAMKVLSSGKHLLCEKPLTTTLANARKVARKAAQAQQKEGVVHMMNFSYRDSSAVQEAIRLVNHGDLGEIRHVHSSYLQSWLSTSIWGDWHSQPFLWRLETENGSGGVLGDVGCHLLDLVTAVAGDLEAVDCRFGTFPKLHKSGRKLRTWKGKKLDANDTAIIDLHFASGALGVCHTTRWATGHANSITLAVYGTLGALRIDLDEGFNRLNLCLGEKRHKAKWTTRKVRTTPSIYQRFIRSIKTATNDQPDIIRGAQVQSYLDACERSAKRNGATTKIRAWL